MNTLLISYAGLQTYWWVIISVLAGALVFLLFVQGGQSFIFSLPENETERTIIVNTMGRKWEFTFTTLVVFGGTFFASFPLFYATSFGGAYWFWTIILFSFIIQAVSYEYRSKAGNILGKKTFDTFLFLNGSLGPFLLGTIVATLFTGAAFSLNGNHQVIWSTRWYGLEALGNIHNLALGFAVLFLSRVNGLLFIAATVEHDHLLRKSFRRAVMNAVPFLVFFLFFVIRMLLSTGYTYNKTTATFTPEKLKYLNNLFEMPVVLIMFLGGVITVLAGLVMALRNKRNAIWFTAPGTVITVISMFLTGGLNNTAFYPSLTQTQDSLSISNASSSLFTLRTMMYVSFSVPFIIAYIWYAWNSITKVHLTEQEMNSDTHKY